MVFGEPQEWDRFTARNAAFVQQMDRLHKLVNLVVAGSRPLHDPIDKVVHTFGRIGVDEFYEILTNAANGYGIAALKLLRPLAERTITMMYLIRRPELVHDFLDYYWVNTRRSMNHVRSAGGDPVALGGEDFIQLVEARFAQVRDRYIEMVCKTCGIERVAGNWTLLNLADMAKAVGFRAGYFVLCYWPTLQLHTTVQGMHPYVDVLDDRVSVGGQSQSAHADTALLGAHTCLSILLEEQIRQLRLDIDVEPIREIYRASWPGRAFEGSPPT